MSNNKPQTIPIPKSYFEKILKPINRLTESCVLKSNGSALYSICSSEDKSVILYAKLVMPLECEEDIRLNIINIKKLMLGLGCLGDDGEFSVKFHNNHIVCHNDNNGEKTHFKYHLVDDSVISECPIKIDKISGLSFDTTFNLSASKAKQILSAASFASDVSKVYLSAEDGVIKAEVDDKTLSNVDNMTIPITTQWEGEPLDSSFPLSLEIFKNLVALKGDIKVKINNQFKVVIFHVEEEAGLELKFILSALVK